MSLNRLFDPLRLHANIALCDRGAAVQQKQLDKGDIEAAVFNLCRISFAEAVSDDPLEAQVITDDGKLLPDLPSKFYKKNRRPDKQLFRCHPGGVLLFDESQIAPSAAFSFPKFRPSRYPYVSPEPVLLPGSSMG